MSNIKELIRDEIRKWQSNIEAKCPESTSSRNYTKEEWNAIYEYNAYTRILSFLDTLPDESITTCNELEEAAEKSARQYYVDGGYSPFPNTETASHIAGFKSGSEWQKAKMMEGAANAYILKSYNPVTEQGKPTLHAIELVYEDEGKPYLMAGQKARIIILPKED